jgi:hypothetical protein
MSDTFALCEAGCGRPATTGSGGKWCYWDDPAIEASAKLAARQVGGRRGQLTPAEAARLFDALEPGSAESRNACRLELMKRRATGKLSSGMFRDLLSALDGMSKDQPKLAPTRGPLVVEVQSTNGREAPA